MAIPKNLKYWRNHNYLIFLWDPSERFEISEKHPEVIADINKLIGDHKSKMVFGPNNLEKRIAK